MKSTMDRPLIATVATQIELARCPDVILVRYNGHPGDDLSPLALESLGADYQFYGKNPDGVVFPGWPIRVRDNRFCAIPNCQENLDILAKFKVQKEPTSEMTASGVIHKDKPYPPMYEIVGDDVVQVSPEALLQAFMSLSKSQRAALLGGLTEADEAPVAPPAAHPQQAKIDDLNRLLTEEKAALAEADVVLASDASDQEKSKASKRKDSAERSIASIEGKLKQLV